MTDATDDARAKTATAELAHRFATAITPAMVEDAAAHMRAMELGDDRQVATAHAAACERLGVAI